MQRVSLGLTIATCLLASVGCQSLRPLPIHEPKTLLDSRDPSSGLGPPTTLSLARRTLWSYEKAYGEKADELYGAKYKTDDGTFAGGVLGIAAGLTKSTETAILGTIVSGASSTTAQRYSLLIQATNYANAASAMECMSGVLAFPKLEEEIDFPVLAQRIGDVRRKLRTSQAQIDLAKTDTSALEAAIKAKLEAIAALEKAEAEKKAAEKKVADAKSNEAELLQRSQLKGFKMSTLASQQLSLSTLAVDRAEGELAAAEVDLAAKARESNSAALLKCSTAY